MREKNVEIHKLISYIWKQDYATNISYSKLLACCDLTISEIRTIVKILNEYNVIYPKTKVGLFKNPMVEYWNSTMDLQIDEDNDFVYIKSDTLFVKFNKGDFSTIKGININQIKKVKDYMTLICLAHAQINFYYMKSFSVNPEKKDELIFKRVALSATDEHVIFESKINTKEVFSYK